MKRKKGDKILVWVMSYRSGIAELASLPAVVVCWGSKRVSWEFESHYGFHSLRQDYHKEHVTEDPCQFNSWMKMVTGRLVGAEWESMKMQLLKSFLEAERARYERDDRPNDGRWMEYKKWRLEALQEQAAGLGLCFGPEGKVQKV